MNIDTDKGIEITFKHTISVSDQVVYFAFCPPWSYEEDQVIILTIFQFRNFLIIMKKNVV